MLADLSVNYVERFVLRCGFAVRRIVPDYGMDLEIVTFDEQGYRENGQIWMQLKATDRLRKSRDGKTASIPIERRDILAWLGERFPVILVLYDGVADRAYYLSIKDHFAGPGVFAKLKGREISVPIPTVNVMSEAAMREFARAKLAGIPQKGDHPW